MPTYLARWAPSKHLVELRLLQLPGTFYLISHAFPFQIGPTVRAADR